MNEKLDTITQTLQTIIRFLAPIASAIYAMMAMAFPERSIEFLLFAILYHLWSQD